MNRNARIFLVVLLGFVTPLVACPPTPLPWKILDPGSGTPSYSGDIACEGEATTAANYIIKIVVDTGTVQSKQDTSTQCAWGTTVSEPSGGWPLNGQSFRAADLELWSGGTRHDKVSITLN